MLSRFERPCSAFPCLLCSPSWLNVSVRFASVNTTSSGRQCDCLHEDIAGIEGIVGVNICEGGERADAGLRRTYTAWRHAPAPPRTPFLAEPTHRPLSWPSFVAREQAEAGDAPAGNPNGDVSMVGGRLRHMLPHVLALLYSVDPTVRTAALELLSEFLKQVSTSKRPVCSAGGCANALALWSHDARTAVHQSRGDHRVADRTTL